MVDELSILVEVKSIRLAPIPVPAASASLRIGRRAPIRIVTLFSKNEPVYRNGPAEVTPEGSGCCQDTIPETDPQPIISSTHSATCLRSRPFESRMPWPGLRSIVYVLEYDPLPVEPAL